MDDKEKLSNYQLALENTLDLEKIMKAIKADVNLKDPDIFKTYKHSLFSPILSFLIKYINEHGEKKGYIGKAKIKNLEVLYAVLNREIYDLFFNKEKCIIRGEESTEIDFDNSMEEEDYLLSHQNYENILDTKALKIMALNLIDEEDSNFQGKDIDTIENIYEFKKREIISSFRMGYSIQERIISNLLENSKDKIKELPNILFYKKNDRKKLYFEIDRILLSKEEISFPNIKVYYKGKYISGQTTFETNERGEILKFEKNSLNFIEVKNSINTLSKDIKKEKEKEDEKKAPIITIKTSSNISSKTSKSGQEKKKLSSKHLKKLKVFLELFRTFKVKYQKINIIYIIDGFFTKDYFKTINDFADRYYTGKIENYNFDLWFAQIESDAIFVHGSNVVNKIRNDLKNFKIEFDKKYKDLQRDYQEFKIESKQKFEKFKNETEAFKKESEQKYNDFKLELDRKYNNLESDLEQRYKDIQENYENYEYKYDSLNEKFEKGKERLENLEKQLNEMRTKDILRRLKKKIKKIINKNPLIRDYLEKLVVSQNKDKNIIIGNYYHNKFTTYEKLPLNDNNNIYENIIDLTTYARIDSFKNEKNIIELIENKHEKNFDKYTHVEFSKLSFLADKIFIDKFFSIFKEQFLEKKIIN